MRLPLLAIVLGVAGVCAAPVVVVERQTTRVDAATKLAVVALIMQYDLQPWCTTWVANLTKYPLLFVG
jgi:hypothetical protein